MDFKILINKTKKSFEANLREIRISGNNILLQSERITLSKRLVNAKWKDNQDHIYSSTICNLKLSTILIHVLFVKCLLIKKNYKATYST